MSAPAPKTRIPVVETVDASTTKISMSRLTFTLALLLLVALPWLLMSDLFQTPKTVIQSRTHYHALWRRYQANKDTWIQQKDQVLDSMTALDGRTNPQGSSLSFTNLPLEILMAYLEDNLHFSQKRFPSMAWYLSPDTENPTLILSKMERRWPMKIIQSVEISLFKKGDHLQVELQNMRRGKRKTAQENAWAYFAAEMEALRGLETFSRRLKDLTLMEYEDKAALTEVDPVHLSWKYQPSHHW